MKCPEVLFLDSLWHTAAKRWYSLGISSLSRHWFRTNPLTGKLTCVFILSELLFQQLRWSIMVNTSGWVWILVVTSDMFELLQFLQSLLSICSIPKSQFSKPFKDIDGLSWRKCNIISMKSTFVWEICCQRLIYKYKLLFQTQILTKNVPCHYARALHLLKWLHHHCQTQQGVILLVECQICERCLLFC